MPNWIINKLEIIGEKKEIKKVLETIKGTNEDGTVNEFDFNKVIKLPEEEKENWYEWNITNWGTKWNTSYVYIEDNIIDFDTVWCGTPKIILKLSKMFPKVEFHYKYVDGSGMLDNYGKYIFNNGITTKTIFESESKEYYDFLFESYPDLKDNYVLFNNKYLLKDHLDDSLDIEGFNHLFELYPDLKDKFILIDNEYHLI